ncbi:MAG TPA: helix-turn-helix transcriptional regulator [Ktedonobacteraceae bacterium]|nr:helix-turn-helix transcriptional regulator [Ktedonobacteraceae bacterium]
MRQHNALLKSARLRKSWTAEFVSSQVGVSRDTYMRWESGMQTPRHSSLNALCKVFGMSPAELGFADLADKKAPEHKVGAGRKGISSPNIPALDQEQIDPSEALSLWAMGLASCWQLYMMGGQEELAQLLPVYLTNLSKPTLQPGPDQQPAARLIAQVHQLTALLALQRGDFVAAQLNGTQALVYSQLAKDANLYIASQIRLASIFSACKRAGAALHAYNDALRRAISAREALSPVLHSWVFAGLSEIQASMGRKQEAINFLQLAFALFPDRPENDPCASYAQCDHSMLFLYEGLVFLRLGRPKNAWEALAQIDNMKPMPPERVRTEFLKHKTYTALILGNMIQSCIYLEATVKAAQAINSDLIFGEVYTIYEHMLALWGQEARVRELARLFQR